MDHTEQRKDAGYYTFSRPEVRQYVPASAKTILDIGCGTGAVGAALKEANPGREVTGIEIVPEVAAQAALKLDRVLVGDVQEQIAFLPDHYFDVIIAADVLEHLVEPEIVLKQIAAKCKPNGLLIASIPNVAHWSIITALLNGSWEYTSAGLLDSTHLRFFTRKSIIRLLEETGFHVLLMTPNIVGSFRIPSQLLQALVEMGIDPRYLAEHAFDYQYITVAKPFRDKKKATVLRELFGVERTASIVVLAYNQLEYTKQCLDSIFRETHEPFELICIDNGSSDGTAEYLQELRLREPRLRVIRNERNLGFAYACNQGLAAAQGDYVVLLNNDIVVTPSWLTRMMIPCEVDPKIGIVGPRSNYTAGIQLLQGVNYGDNLEKMRVFAEKWQKENIGFGWEVTRVIGFCMLIKREVIETIGGFDTRFGIGNFEDDDYCLRAMAAGFKVRVANDVFVHHYGSKSFSQLKVDYRTVLERNWFKFKEKWGLDQERPIELGYHPMELLKNRPVICSLKVPLKNKDYPPSKALEIEPSHKCRFLMWPDWFEMTGEWQKIVEAYIRAFTSKDEASLIIIVDPALKVNIANVETLILDMASKIKNLDDLPDIILYNDPLPHEEITKLYRAADYFLPCGELEEALHEIEAVEAGCQIVKAKTFADFREIYETWQEHPMAK